MKNKEKFKNASRESETSSPLITVYGYHAALAMVNTYPERIQSVWIRSDRNDQRFNDLLDQLAALSCDVEMTSQQKLDERFPDANHQGIILFCTQSEPQSESALEAMLEKKENPFLLILDGVQDPHNLGACLRTADAVGVDAVIIPKDRAAGLTPAVRKVASGAAETVPLIMVTNLARTLQLLKDYRIWVYGFCDSATQSLYETQFDGGVALVLGAEENGLRRLTREHCDYLLSIPMSGTVASLNVSVATAVSLYEVKRQRLGS